MTDHRMSALTQCCLGCGIAASEVCDKAGVMFRGKPKWPGIEQCPAHYVDLQDGDEQATFIVKPDETLIIERMFERITLGKVAMFELRDAIDDGVAKHRRKS